MHLSTWRRVVIRGMRPEVECGRFAAKRVVGDDVQVEADVFSDGHDVITCVLEYRHESENAWQEVPMEALPNDHWRGRFRAEMLGIYFYRLVAWVDPFKTWHADLQKRIAASQDISVELQIGRELLMRAALRASGADRDILRAAAQSLTPDDIDENLLQLEERYADRSKATVSDEMRVRADRLRARFSAWYEIFPRSAGTLRDCERLVPEIASMGFDVLYFPPIHPIGHTHRKGKNNSRKCRPGDPGSPWAIGAQEGGHKSIHPELGTVEDFRHLASTAKKHGLEIALDLAYQCSPDHPYVKEHPQWFRMRPDGMIQYAENPPKKYEDILPFDFETPLWQSLWEELKSVVEFWIERGVRIFRVDNPHTKPFQFWEWMITDLMKRYPDLILLSEAFTRPNIMYQLAKLGFTQSYTYFTWRNTKWELTEYFRELTKTEVGDFFRPNLWPNTPDILHEYLQKGGRPAFMTRLVLAATLGANYGMYGPAYELCENLAREPGSEEYLDSEKYEIKRWNTAASCSLRPFITRVNAIRRENPALQSNERLEFHHIENNQIICYSKRTADNTNVIVVVVNLDWKWTQSGFVELPLEEFGVDGNQPYRVTDLLTDAVYTWQGPRNYVELRPHELPAHILRLR